MNENENLVPKRRFKEFTNSDAWEQRKLGDTFEFSVSTNSLSRAQLNYEKGNIKSIHYGDILIKYNSILEITKDKIPFITDGSIEKYKPNLLENGDVVFADAAEDETVGKAVEINGISDEYVVAGLHTIVARPKEKMAKYFSGYYINADVYQRQLLRLMQGTKVSSISKGNLKKTIVAYPKNLAEQQKIGSFFKQLDNAIALHQRKLTLLQRLKQTYMQGMFPQNWENIPSLRLDGFSEPWEQRKLGELSEIVRGASPRPIQDPKWFDSNSNVGWLRISDVTEQNGRITYLEQKISKAGQEKTRVLFEPHLLLSIAATVGKPVVNYVNTGVHDGFLIFLNPIFDREYMFQWLEMFRPKWQKYGQPGSQVNLNSELVRNQDILLPSMEEQTKIGIIFKQLDDSIALHQCKLEKLIELKHVLLEKMFL